MSTHQFGSEGNIFLQPRNVNAVSNIKNGLPFIAQQTLKREVSSKQKQGLKETTSVKINGFKGWILCRPLIVTLALSAILIASPEMLMSYAGHDPQDEAKQQKVLLSALDAEILGIKSSQITLSPVKGLSMEDSKLLTLVNSGNGSRFHLVMKGIRVHQDPGVIYAVHLSVCGKKIRKEPKLVGYLNFYSFSGTPDGKPGNNVFFSWDVTDALLSARISTLDHLQVSLTPSGTPTTSSKVTIGRVELTAQPDSRPHPDGL